MPMTSAFKSVVWITGLALASFVVSSAAFSLAAADSDPNLSDPSTNFQSDSKLTPRLLAAVDAGREADALVFVQGRPDLAPARALTTKEAKGEFVVDALRATAEQTQAGLRRFLDERGIAYEPFWIVNMVRVRGNEALISELASRSEVDKIDINIRVRALEPAPGTGPSLNLAQPVTSPWGVASIGAPAVWERGIRGQGIVVAGNDTGVDWEHEALLDAYRGWDGEMADHNYNWYDAWDKAPLVPSDDHGHGTHTIGTSVGAGPNQIGVAPDAKWMACRNMDSGFGTPASYVACFQFFLAPVSLDGEDLRPDLAPHIINNSWACPESEGCYPSDPLWDDTIRPAVEALTEAGIGVVVAAGNTGPTCGTVQNPPAIYPPSLTVGAVREDYSIADFSSRGPITVDGSGIPAPDLSAPGVNIFSSTRNDEYGHMSGTSAAAPHLAGTVALLWSAEPRLVGRLVETEQVLRASARPASAGACGGDPDGQPNNSHGWGIIDADAAVSAAETMQELRGTVTDSYTKFLSGVEVRIVDPVWEIEVHLRTGARGNYATMLLPGNYEVVIDTPNHPAVSARITVPVEGPVTHNVVLKTCVDWNDNGRTDMFEMSEMMDAWHSAAYTPRYDLNGDGAVDIVDVALLATHIGDHCNVIFP